MHPRAAGQRAQRGRGPTKKLSEAARLLALGELDINPQTHDAERQQQDEALAAFGGVADRGANEPDDRGAFELWPENLPALRLWFDVSTQWRVSMAGATGLDYAGVEVVLRMRGVRGAERVERFNELRTMEAAALRVAADQRERCG